MQTTFRSLVSPLDHQFSFAGLDFPKYLWTLPKGKPVKRLEAARQPFTGGYIHAPTPNARGIRSARFFYLESDLMPRLRWQWCDQVLPRLAHTGWFCDEHQDSKIRGLVLTLPRSRGFLAGWSMGESFASELDCYVYETAEDAARAADSMAERAAENQREFEAKERAEMEKA